MRYRIELSAEVNAQILSAVSYYEGIQEGLGGKLEEEVDAVLRAVVENPLQYRKEFGPVHRAYMKRFKQVFFYTIRNDAVVVTEMRDARREPPDWKAMGYQSN